MERLKSFMFMKDQSTPIIKSNENNILSTSFLLELKGIESVVEKQSVTVE